MPTRTMLRAKLHRLRLTGANPDYAGSVAIDSALMDAGGIVEFEQVHVWNVTNGERLVTYAIAAPPGTGEVCLNGAAALRGAPGDIVIIATFAAMTDEEARGHLPRVVYVDEANRVRRPNEESDSVPKEQGLN